MKKRYSIMLNVEVEVEKAANGRKIPWFKFIGWKHGVVSKPNRFIDTEPIVQMTEQNMKYIGEEIFKAAREMFYEDNELKD